MSGQADFSRALFAPDFPLPTGLREVGDSIPLRRFNVYRNNVVVSLCDALAKTFPVTRQMVGDQFFAAMAREFVQDHPPRSPVMSGYGDKFPGFVHDFAPVANLPYLADVARLEFLQVEAFHAADAAPLAPDALSRFAPEQLSELHFITHPATRLLTSAFAVASIWFAHQGQGDLGEIELSRPEVVLITRPGLSVQLYRLPDALQRFLSSVLAGGTLGHAAEGILSNPAGSDLTAGLTLLLESGAVAAVVLDEDVHHGST